jgi:hypothetical protein
MDEQEPIHYKYTPVDKSKIRKKDAQALGEMLAENRLRNNGAVDIHEIIKGKDDPESPQYRYFTHDVEEAAQKQWEVEARYIVRSIQTEVVKVRFFEGKEEKQVFKVRAFPAVPQGDNSSNYMHVSDVIASKQHSNSLHQNLYKYVLSAFDRYAQYLELTDYLEDLKPVLYNLAEQIDLSEEEVDAKIETIVSINK